MKYFSFSILTIILLGFITLQSCDRDLPQYIGYPAYTYSSVDEGAGNWNPVVLNTPDQITISAPSDVTSAEFLAELAITKEQATTLAGQERAIVEYWSNNPNIRWNEIALELAAKYNLIPGPNPDGTYTLPNAMNPGVAPFFPFAHPPYTSRMLAYLSVAQFDASISAYHYKYLHNRPGPGVVDNTIPLAYGNNNIPAYPSDAAAIAVVSQTVLGAMFPLEKDYLAEKAEQHLNSLIWSGQHVNSDIEAGKIIGAEVTKVVMARAMTDGMSKAQAPKPVADSIKFAADSLFGWHWENIEVPPRPVGLTPLFGKVKMWSVANVIEVRLPTPPAIGSDEYLAAVAELEEFQDNMKPEWRAISNFWQDGLGTYTPPGHWNRLAKEFVIKHKWNPVRTARMFAYLNMAMMDAGIACWDSKYYYHYPRPINVIPGFKTIAGTPNFPSYPSGHSSFSAAASGILSYMFPEEAAYCHDWALEAAQSRVYGGIHWNFDATGGTTQGYQVADHVLAIARTDGAD